MASTPPVHSSSNTIRSGISPNLNVVASRPTYPGCGIGYPVSSAFAFQNTFAHPVSTKNTSHHFQDQRFTLTCSLQNQVHPWETLSQEQLLACLAQLIRKMLKIWGWNPNT
uniref:Spindle assembly abnormal protein 6 homolog n=1 Tax=Castor canadensis TaxID=51338 RepID=A0A8B7UBQ6_CASCN|nr:spindle assembly abnormal protein 6 homolog [Castor canadensis]